MKKSHKRFSASEPIFFSKVFLRFGQLKGKLGWTKKATLSNWVLWMPLNTGHIWRTQPIWAGVVHFPPLCCSFHRYLSQEESTDDAPGQVGRMRGARHNTSKGVSALNGLLLLTSNPGFRFLGSSRYGSLLLANSSFSFTSFGSRLPMRYSSSRAYT